MNDHHNEISVIGSLLISPETFEIISSSLTSSDFGDDWCRAAWLAAVALNDNGEVIDIAAISELMSKAGFKNNSAWLLDCILTKGFDFCRSPRFLDCAIKITPVEWLASDGRYTLLPRD